MSIALLEVCFTVGTRVSVRMFAAKAAAWPRFREGAYA